MYIAWFCSTATIFLGSNFFTLTADSAAMISISKLHLYCCSRLPKISLTFPSSPLPHAVSSRCSCAAPSCIYVPCHVLSLPKSCSQLRSPLRSAGVDGAEAQRAGAHYFYFLTEAVNHFCSDVHRHSISPTRDQTTPERPLSPRNLQLLSFTAYCREQFHLTPRTVTKKVKMSSE